MLVVTPSTQLLNFTITTQLKSRSNLKFFAGLTVASSGYFPTKKILYPIRENITSPICGFFRINSVNIVFLHGVMLLNAYFD